MARFLIEVPHEPERVACARVVEIFFKTGSHFLTHADWGCMDGVHKAWIIAEVGSKEEAGSILPPPLRSQAKIVQLNCFTSEEIDAILRHHQASRWQPEQSHPSVEGRGIRAALQQTDGAIEGPKGAAKVLNLHPNTLRHRTAKLGIKRPAHRQP
jgi:transcriptional regulator with GAF, ATPase, and Fis domain